MFQFLQQVLSQYLNAIKNAIATLADTLSGSGDYSLATDTAPAGSLIGTVADGHGLLIHVYGEETDGAVHMTVKVMEGVADLRGFYMDVGDSVAGIGVEGVARSDYAIGNECVTSVGARDNNMNGTGESFDVGVEIGTAGYKKDDISQASFTIQGVTLEDLDGLTFGVRATSVGEDRGDAVKLVGEFDIPEPEPEPEPAAEPAPVAEAPAAEAPATPPVQPPVETPAPAPAPSIGGNFPQLPDDITSIVLYYNTPSGDMNADGYYAAKVDNVSWVVEDDLDLWLIDATNYLEKHDPNVQEGTALLGVAISHGATTEYYAMDGDQGADAAPTSDLTPDITVSYDAIMG